MYNIIHIGANKSASTSIQKCLFSKLSTYDYIGENSNSYDWQKNNIVSIIRDDDYFYLGQGVQNNLKEYINSLSKPVIFSSEDLISCHMPSLCAKRMYELLPSSKILFVIRNQYTAIYSYYLNHGSYLRDAPNPHYRKFVEFDQWFKYYTKIQKSGPIFSFNYNDIINIYESYFGSENIKILMYEDLIVNPDSFYTDLSLILGQKKEKLESLMLGCRERRGSSGKLNFLIRKYSFNYHHSDSSIYKFLESCCAKLKLHFSLSKTEMNIIKEQYSNGNKLLQEKYKLDLNGYGYPL